jgi:hypothetical protein
MPTNSAHDDTLPSASRKGKKQCKHPTSMAKKTGVFSSPGELVFQNELLLSEIYKHLDTKGDQKTCLLVCKSGYDTAAKRLYREMRIEDLAPFFAGNCSIVSIPLRAVRSQCGPDQNVYFSAIRSD